jgi:uncharacterized protein YlxW (UPF0749 family)
MSFIAIASVAMTVATTMSSIRAQQQAAAAQAKAQANATKAERMRHLQEMTAQRIEERQEQVAKAQKVQSSTKKAREARATAQVAAGESGVSGLSVTALINDLTRQEGEYRYSLTKQAEFDATNRTLGLKDGGMRSYMNQLSINKPIPQPDYLGSTLNGINAGMGTASTIKSFQ